MKIPPGSYAWKNGYRAGYNQAVKDASKHLITMANVPEQCPTCSPYGCDDCVADKQCPKCHKRMCDSCLVGDHGLGKHVCRKK